MRKRLAGAVKSLAVIWSVCFALSPMAAAGEWEWAKGQEWTRGGGTAQDSSTEQLRRAFSLEMHGEYLDSARQYYLLTQNFPDSPEAGVALQRLSLCLFEMEDYWEAYKAVEQVVLSYPESAPLSDLVEVELRIAKNLLESQSPEYLPEDEEEERDVNIERVVRILDSVIAHAPYGGVADEAYQVKGEAHLILGEDDAARAAFQTVIDEFPHSEYVEPAHLGIRVADALNEVEEHEHFLSPEDDEETVHPDSEVQDILNSLKQLPEVEAAKMVEQARKYQSIGTRKTILATQFLYNEVIRRYPKTAQAEEAKILLADLESHPLLQRGGTEGKKAPAESPFTNKDPEPPWIVPQVDGDAEAGG